MKKRLRKKKHMGEFTEWGRQLIVYRNTKMHADAFHDAFMHEAIAVNGCYCGGTLSNDKINVVIELGRKSEDLESKFANVTDWLDQRSDIEKWRSGPLFDIWYGKFDEIE